MSRDDTSSLLNVIRARSLLGYARGASVVDDLIAARWCDCDDFTAAYSKLESLDGPFAAVFFQLPFVTRAPLEWLPMEREASSFLRLHPIGVATNRLDPEAPFAVGERERRDTSEPMTNACLENDPYGVLVRTQAVAVFTVDGIRSQFYHRYINCVSSDDSYSKILVDAGESWVQHRALPVHAYEDDLVRYLIRKTIVALRTFLPLYSFACRDPSAALHNWERLSWLNSPFCMMLNGRLVTSALGHTIPGLLARPLSLANRAPNGVRLRALVAAGRRISQYERALLHARRLAETGAPHLAMVHVAMILEWFADVQINHRLVPLLSAKAEAEGGTSSASSSRRQGKRSPLIPKRIPAIERYATYLPQIGITLPPALLADVRQVITWQNVIVHEDPEPDSVTPDEACNAVETGMAVIEHALSCLRQRTGSSP